MNCNMNKRLIFLLKKASSYMVLFIYKQPLLDNLTWK